MNYELAYYEDKNIKIEIKDNEVFYTCKSSSPDKGSMELSLNIFKYLSEMMHEINSELQPERLSEETSKDEAIV